MRMEGIVCEAGQAWARVRLEAGGCTQGGCHHAGEVRRLWVHDPFGVRPGEHVVVEMHDRDVLRAMLAAFGWPFVAWIAVALALVRTLGAPLAWAAGMAAAALVWRRAGRRARFAPEIVERMGDHA